MNTSPVDPRDLRVSDDERSHVLALLEKATGRGLIDLGEYTERSALVIGARTRRELNAVLLDLPGLEIAGRTVDAAQHAAQPPSRPTPGFSGAPAPPSRSNYANGDVLELTGWGSRTFRGYWTAPPLIVIGGTGASTRLDFTEAQLLSPTVTVEFRSNYGGATEIVVPQGSAVRVDGLQMRGGHINNKVPPAGAAKGMTLLLTGVKKGGSVTVRHPRAGMFAHWF
ncbi:MAG: DUF1707 domain-containing protein [Nakamurella sp.]